MNAETKNIYELYKLTLKINVGKFYGCRTDEIIMILERYTGVMLDYKEFEELKQAINKCRIKNGVI